MPTSNYLKLKMLDQWLGNQSPTVATTMYVGLVLQCGTLSTALTAGTSYTSLACASNTVAYAIAANDLILIGTGSTTQLVQASGSASVSATSVAATSFIANAGYSIGTPFIRCDAYATAQEPSSGAYARVSMTNNTTNWPTPTGTFPAISENGTTVTFPTATGSWGTVAGFLIGDNATQGSGNIWFYGALNAAQAVNSGNTPTFPTDELFVTLV